MPGSEDELPAAALPEFILDFADCGCKLGTGLIRVSHVRACPAQPVLCTPLHSQAMDCDRAKSLRAHPGLANAPIVAADVVGAKTETEKKYPKMPTMPTNACRTRAKR